MGTALGTQHDDIRPTSWISGRRRTGKANLSKASTNSNNNNNNNNSDGERVHSAFAKLTLIQDCFLTINNKEGKVLSDRRGVPSYIVKSRGKAGRDPPRSSSSNHSTSSRPASLLGNEVSSIEGVKYSTEGRNPFPIVQNDCGNSPEWGLHLPSDSLTLSETLKYVGCYTFIRCRRLEGLKPSVVVSWIRSVDKNLILSGWQDHAFVSQANMIVLYMLLREVLRKRNIATVAALQMELMACLYMCYSYNGQEISYPLKPFLPSAEGGREGSRRLPFWNKCISIINNYSNIMLLINRDSGYFYKIQDELRIFGRSLEKKAT